MSTIAENLLYECIRELSYIQEIPCNSFDLHATALGKELIERGMIALNIRELAEGTLDAQRLAEWNKMHTKTAATELELRGTYEVPFLERKYKCSKCGYPLGNDDGLCADCAAAVNL